MSYANSDAFAAKRERSRALSAARRAQFARELAEIDIQVEAEVAGQVKLTPESFIFAMETGVDPVEVSADVARKDH